MFYILQNHIISPVNNVIQIILFQERENEYFVECRFASVNI